LPTLQLLSLGSSNRIVTYFSDSADRDDQDRLAARHARAKLIARACISYLNNRDFGDALEFPEVPSENCSFICNDESTERKYVILGSSAGELLAVYRLDSRWKLKRLSRYPEAVLDMFANPNEDEAACRRRANDGACAASSIREVALLQRSSEANSVGKSATS
jgi:hypothetical protein